MSLRTESPSIVQVADEPTMWALPSIPALHVPLAGPHYPKRERERRMKLAIPFLLRGDAAGAASCFDPLSGVALTPGGDS